MKVIMCTSCNDIPAKGNAVRIATFDKEDGITEIQGTVMNPATGYPENGIAQSGSDNGVQRSITINQDWIDQKYFIPGKKYYFAVTAYTYNSNAQPNNTETVIKLVEAVFQKDEPGYQYGNQLRVIYPGTTSQSAIKPIVVDPSQLTHHTYKIIFDSTGWDLFDNDLNTQILNDETAITDNSLAPVIDGIQFKMKFTPDILRFSLTSNANGPVTSKAGYDKTPLPDFNGYSADWYRDASSAGSIFNLSGMEVNGGFYFIVAPVNYVNIQDINTSWFYSANWDRLSKGKKYEIRFTEDGGKAWMWNSMQKMVLIDVPFEVWYLGSNFNDPSDDVRFMPRIRDKNLSGQFDFYLDHPASPDEDDPYSDAIMIIEPEQNAPPGEQAYLNAIQRTDSNFTGYDEIEHLGNIVLMNYNQLQGSGGVNEMPETGTTFLIEVAADPIPGVDEFLITDSVVSGIKPLEIPNEYFLSQNYPNPFNPNTAISFNLPERGLVNLTVYNILGQKVKTLINNLLEAGKHKINFSGNALSSGVYIYNIQVNSKSGIFVSSRKMMLIK